MKKFTLKTILVAALAIIGINTAKAEVETIYERSSTSWASTDIADWGNAGATINGGLSQSGTNGSFEASKAFTFEATSKVTLTATFSGGNAPGRAGSYDYISFGGIEVRLDGQNQVGTIVCGATTSSLSGFSRGGTYNVTIVYDPTQGNAVCTVSGGSTGTATISNPGSAGTVKIGHFRAGRENYAVTVVLKSIKIEEEKQQIATADYTVKRMCGTTAIQADETRTGAVGGTITIGDGDKTPIYPNNKKYIYVSDDAEGKSIAEDNSTVVTVNFREAATWNYSLTSDKKTVIAKGSNFEGESIPVGYPRYLLSKNDSTLYEAPATSQSYYKSVVLDANNKNIEIAYNASTKNSVVFYSEGENIPGASTTIAGNIHARASNYASGYTLNDLLVTKLPAGKYKIVAGIFCNYSSDYSSRILKFNVGSKTLTAACANVNVNQVELEEFEISVTTPVYFLAEGSGSGLSLDYIYIVKTGHVDEAENPYGDWLEVDNTGNTGDKVDEGYLVVDPTTKQENGMITFPEETPETEGADAGDAATGINNAQTAGAQVVGIYSANGAKAAQLQKGLNIIKLANGKSVKVVK